MRVRLFYHDRCFDGACSAAVFRDFFQKTFAADAEFVLGGLFHRSDQLFDEAEFDGDENVIVDFKYCASPKLTWWFDHHQSAFLSEADEAHFRADTSGKKFYDPDCKSCTKFIARVARERFGYETSALQELIKWADIIDGAKYTNAKEAVEIEHPAMQLTLIFEAAKQNRTAEVIPLMTQMSLAEIMQRPELQQEFQVLYDRHRRSIDTIRERARLEGDVIFFDLTDTDLAGYNKFIPYYLFPEHTYTVSVLDAGFRAKVSVGSNPWAPSTPTHNLASICESYGGGGHPRVGAISYGPGEIERARRTAEEIVGQLSGL